MSQNVFADMDLQNPEERLLKAELVLAIRELVDDSKLTQMQVAERVGMTQPAVSRMLTGMTKEISVEKLLKVVTAMGNPVRIVIGAHESRPVGTSVEFASHEELSVAVA